MLGSLILALLLVEGDWFGVIDFGAQKLRIVFHIKAAADGKLYATADSPDQGAVGLPVGAVEFTGGKLMIDLPAQGAFFSGIVSGEQIEGTFRQATSVPLTLRRTPIAVARPQIPSKPYPYDELEVTFKTLAGTMTMPRGPGPFPALVLISGSGPQTRNQVVAGHPTFLVLAHHLTQQGFAVLRYDDRGVGKSGGDFSKATTADFANDASEAIDFLRAQPKIFKGKIGLLGHSEGAIVAPMVKRDFAFLVLLAPSAVSGRDLILAQKTAILQAAGVSSPDLAPDRAVYEALLAGKSDAMVGEVAKAMLGSLPAAAQASQLKFLTSLWFRYFLAYDPAPSFAKLRVPALVLFGGKDLQVLPSQNAPPLRALGNKFLTVETIPDVNHLFQTAKTGSPSEYSNIDETISPAVLKRISEWSALQASR